MRFFRFAWSVALLAGLFGGAVLPAQAATYTDTLQGIEISPGIVIGQVRYGTAFVGVAGGDLPGVWAVSFRYSPPHPGPGQVNKISGGSWTLSVYQGGMCKGKLYGSISGGFAQWDNDGSQAAAQVNLTILGGTGLYSGASGWGQFNGVLSHETLIPTMGGSLVLSSTK